MSRILTYGETLLDIVFEDNVVKNAIPGGAMLNTSVSLGRLLIPVSLLSFTGNDEAGALIQQFLSTNNVSTDNFKREENYKTGIALAFLDKFQNAHYSFYKESKPVELSIPEIHENDIFALASFLAISDDYYQFTLYLLTRYLKKNSLIFYDPNFRKNHCQDKEILLKRVIEIIRKSEVIRASDEDVLNLFGTNNVDEIYQEKFGFNNQILILTFGGDKVVLKTKNQYIEYNVPAIKLVSTIGAGDTFNAGLLAMFYHYNVNRINLSDFVNVHHEALIQGAIRFAAESCLSEANYIGIDFAKNQQSKFKSLIK